MTYEGERLQLFDWARKKGPAGLEIYRQEKNRRSMDGLPGLGVGELYHSRSRETRMRKRFGIVIINLLGCLVPVVSFGQAATPPKPSSPLEQTLMTAEKGFVEAAKKGDVAFFKRTLTEDFSYVGFDGQLAGRQERIDELADGGTDLLPYNMKVVTAGDGVAIVTYDVVLRVPAAEDQGPPPRYQHFSTVWVKQGDGWKMKFQQMSVSHWGDW